MEFVTTGKLLKKTEKENARYINIKGSRGFYCIKVEEDGLIKFIDKVEPETILFISGETTHITGKNESGYYDRTFYKATNITVQVPMTMKIPDKD